MESDAVAVSHDSAPAETLPDNSAVAEQALAAAAPADRATKNRAVPNSKTFFMTAPFDEPIRAWQGRIIGRYSAGSKSGAASRLGLSAPNRRIEIPEGVPFAVAAPRRLI